jgi:hypothetical protein
MSEYTPIFIVGSGNSGTSLLLAVLGAHPRLCAIPFESSFALKWPAPCHNARLFLNRCDRYALRMGKKRWVEKTPRHIYRMGEILNYFPEARILLMLRDGRDVACSIRERYISLEAGIDRWIEDNQAGRSFWKHPNVRVVRYEELVTEFEKTMRGVTDFVGEKYEDSLPRLHETPKYYFSPRIEKPPDRRGDNHDQYRNWQINQPLFDGRGKWRSLAAEEKQMIKNKAGEMLIKYGYATDLNW